MIEVKNVKKIYSKDVVIGPMNISIPKAVTTL